MEAEEERTNEYEEIHIFLSSVLERRNIGEDTSLGTRQLDIEFRKRMSRFENPFSHLFQNNSLSTDPHTHAETAYILYILRDLAIDQPRDSNDADQLRNFFAEFITRLKGSGLLDRISEAIPKLFDALVHLSDIKMKTHLRREIELSTQILYFIFYNRMDHSQTYTLVVLSLIRDIIELLHSKEQRSESRFLSSMFEEYPYECHILTILFCSFCELCLIDIDMIRECQKSTVDAVSKVKLLADSFEIQNCMALLSDKSRWKHVGIHRLLVLLWSSVKLQLAEAIPESYGGFMNDISKDAEFCLEDDEMNALTVLTRLLRQRNLHLSEYCETYTSSIKDYVCNYLLVSRLVDPLRRATGSFIPLPGMAMPQQDYWQRMVALLGEIYEILPEIHVNPDFSLREFGVAEVLANAMVKSKRIRQVCAGIEHRSSTTQSGIPATSLNAVGVGEDVPSTKNFLERNYKPLLRLLSALITDESSARWVKNFAQDIVVGAEESLARVRSLLREKQRKRISEDFTELLATDVYFWAKIYRFERYREWKKISVLCDLLCSNSILPALKGAIFSLFSSLLMRDVQLAPPMWNFVIQSGMLNGEEALAQFRDVETNLKAYDTSKHFLRFITRLVSIMAGHFTLEKETSGVKGSEMGLNVGEGVSGMRLSPQNRPAASGASTYQMSTPNLSPRPATPGKSYFPGMAGSLGFPGDTTRGFQNFSTPTTSPSAPRLGEAPRPTNLSSILSFINFAMRDVFTAIHLSYYRNDFNLMGISGEVGGERSTEGTSVLKEEWELKRAALEAVTTILNLSGNDELRRFSIRHIGREVLKGTAVFDRMIEILSAKNGEMTLQRSTQAAEEEDGDSDMPMLVGMRLFPESVEESMLHVLNILHTVFDSEDDIVAVNRGSDLDAGSPVEEDYSAPLQRLSSLLLIKQDYLTGISLLLLPPYSAEIAKSAISLLRKLCGSNSRIAMVLAERMKYLQRYGHVSLDDSVESRLLLPSPTNAGNIEGEGEELRLKFLEFISFLLKRSNVMSNDLAVVLLGLSDVNSISEKASASASLCNRCAGRGGYCAILRLLSNGAAAAPYSILATCVDIIHEFSCGFGSAHVKEILNDLKEIKLFDSTLDVEEEADAEPIVKYDHHRLRYHALLISMLTLELHCQRVSVSDEEGEDVLKVANDAQYDLNLHTRNLLGKLFHPLYDSSILRMLRFIRRRGAGEPRPLGEVMNFMNQIRGFDSAKATAFLAKVEGIGDLLDVEKLQQELLRQVDDPRKAAPFSNNPQSAYNDRTQMSQATLDSGVTRWSMTPGGPHSQYSQSRTAGVGPEDIANILNVAAEWNESVLRFDASLQLVRSWTSLVVVAVGKFSGILGFDDQLELYDAIISNVLQSVVEGYRKYHHSGKDQMSNDDSLSPRVLSHIGEVVVQVCTKARALILSFKSSASTSSQSKTSRDLFNPAIIDLLADAIISANLSQKLRADLACGFFHYLRLIENALEARNLGEALSVVEKSKIVRLFRVVGEDAVLVSPANAIPTYIPCVSLAAVEQMFVSFPFLQSLFDVMPEFNSAKLSFNFNFFSVLLQRLDSSKLSLAKAISLQDPPSLNPLYLFESRIAAISRIAMLGEGKCAEYLLRHDVLSVINNVMKVCLTPFSDLVREGVKDRDIEYLTRASPIPTPRERHHTAFMAVMNALTTLLSMQPGNAEVRQRIIEIISSNGEIFAAVLGKGNYGAQEMHERALKKVYVTTSLFSLLIDEFSSSAMGTDESATANGLYDKFDVNFGKKNEFGEMMSSLVASLVNVVFEDFDFNEVKQLRQLRLYMLRIIYNSLHYILLICRSKRALKPGQDSKSKYTNREELNPITESAIFFRKAHHGSHARDFGDKNAAHSYASISTLTYIIDRSSLEVERHTQKSKTTIKDDECSLMMGILEHSLFILVDHLQYYVSIGDTQAPYRGSMGVSGTASGYGVIDSSSFATTTIPRLESLKRRSDLMKIGFMESIINVLKRFLGISGH